MKAAQRKRKGTRAKRKKIVDPVVHSLAGFLNLDVKHTIATGLEWHLFQSWPVLGVPENTTDRKTDL